MKIHNKKSKIIFILANIGIMGLVLMLNMFYRKRDLMQKYDVYQIDDCVVVENKENPKTFCFKEWIYYSSFIRDSYLCTKEGERPRSEREAYLYVDLGVLGGWWADPFGNLKREKEVSNEYVPDEVISELKKHIHLDFGIPFIQMIDEVEIKELTETEIKKIAPEVFEEVYDDKAVLQWYQQVDFDNDKRMDIVIYNRLGMGKLGFTETYFYQQLPDGMYRRTHQINSSGRATRFLQYDEKNYFMVLDPLDYDVSESEYDYYYCELYYFQDGYPQETVRFTPESTQVDVAVKKRFVNDFINISEGNR